MTAHDPVTDLGATTVFRLVSARYKSGSIILTFKFPQPGPSDPGTGRWSWGGGASVSGVARRFTSPKATRLFDGPGAKNMSAGMTRLKTQNSLQLLQSTTQIQRESPWWSRSCASSSRLAPATSSRAFSATTRTRSRATASRSGAKDCSHILAFSKSISAVVKRILKDAQIWHSIGCCRLRQIEFRTAKPCLPAGGISPDSQQNKGQVFDLGMKFTPCDMTRNPVWLSL